MRTFLILALCLFAFAAGADRRGLLLSKKPAAAGGGGSVGYPGTNVVQVTNSSATVQAQVIGIDIPADGANRGITVNCAWCGNGGPVSSTITVHNGGTVQTMTKLGQQQVMTFGCSNAIFYLANPGTGVNVISNQASGNLEEFAQIIWGWTNANQTTMMDSFAGSTGNSLGRTNSISAANRDVGIDGWNWYDVGHTHTPGTGQELGGTSEGSGIMSIKNSLRLLGDSGTTNMYWTAETAIDNSHVAGRVKAVP